MSKIIDISKLENNQAIVDYITKTLHFKFNNESFSIDLTEGDLTDSWNSFRGGDDVLRDINFHLESEEYEPSASVYPLIGNEVTGYTTDTAYFTKLAIIGSHGTKEQYLGEEFTNNHCPNCGSLQTYKNNSGEIQCDNCGYSEGED